jgi:catechol 2,3-dioxygenase-like lactoylglutathione lyase family enzyme
MDIRIDHVVLWCADPLASAAFFEDVLGTPPVRADEFKAGKVPFPSVRLGETALLDLVPVKMAAMLNAIPGAAGSAGHKVNHVCLSLARADYDQARDRLRARGVATPVTMTKSFGAQGLAPEAVYFADLDGNVIEIRYYE